MDLWLACLILTHIHPHQQQQQHLLQLRNLEPRVSIFLFHCGALFCGLPVALLVIQFRAVLAPFFFRNMLWKVILYILQPCTTPGRSQSYTRELFVYNALILVIVHCLLLFNFYSALFDLPILLFIVQLFVKKYSVLTLDWIPDILILLYINHHHLCKSINIIRQTAPSMSLYRSEWPTMIIDIEEYTEPKFSKLIKQAEGETLGVNKTKSKIFCQYLNQLQKSLCFSC